MPKETESLLLKLTRRINVILCVSVLMMGMTTGAVSAQDNGPPPPSAGQDTGVPLILDRAETIRWDSTRRRLTAVGNVKARYGASRIEADTVTYSETTGWVTARGNVRGRTPLGKGFRGESFSFEVGTNQVRTRRADIDMFPWYLRADKLEGDADTELVVSGGSFTTCNLKTPHYDVKARTIYIYPGERIVAYHAFPRIGSVPVFYWPYLSVDLERDLSRWEFEPGLSDRDGAKLGVSYHYLMEQDEYPFTGTLYTDLSQKTNPGVGLDVDYSEGPGQLYMFYFHSNRKPILSDTDGNKFRADDEENMYRFRTEMDYPIGDSNWDIRGNVDWMSDERLDDVEFSNLSLNQQSRRTFNGGLSYAGERSHLSIQGRRQDRITSDGTGERFERHDEILPRIRYRIHTIPLDFLGEGWHYRFSSDALRRARNGADTFLWSTNVRNSLSKTISFVPGFSQKWDVGYRQQYNERVTSGQTDFESTGSGVFSLDNTISPFSPLSVKLKYDVEKRFNNKSSVPLSLNGQGLGNEDDGFEEHALRFNTSWNASDLYGFLQGGYDLRDSDQFDIDSDSRVISPLLNLSTQLSPTVGWSQFVRYDWANSEVDQLNTAFDYEPTTNFLTTLGWNFNRGSSTDFSDLQHRLLWTFPDHGLKFRSDLIYDTEKETLDETRIMIFKRLHMWGLEIFFRDVRDDDQEISFNINLLDFPPAESGMQRNRGASTPAFDKSDWRSSY